MNSILTREKFWTKKPSQNKEKTPHSPHDLYKNKQTKTNKEKSMKETQKRKL